MTKERVVCPHCGALQRDESGVCDLCGSPMDEDADAAQAAREAEKPDAGDAASADGDGSGDRTHNGRTARPPERARSAPVTMKAGGFCTSCGSPYPEGARYCGYCGEKIIALPPRGAEVKAREGPSREKRAKKQRAKVAEVPSKAPEEAVKAKRAPSDRELGRQILIVVGAGILLVVGLFFITIASKSVDDEPLPVRSEPIEVIPEPLPAEAAETEATLMDEIAALTGAEKRARQGDLIEFYIAQSRPDLAAAVQDSIARETGAEVDWIRAGNLYYDWMDGVDGPAKAAYAKKAIAAYQEALALNPNNHDVRTDMAIAYMYDPDNSMEAIIQTNQVLEENPDHVQANFNKGIMLLRINRFDEAVVQFERVKSILGDSTNQIYQRADEALRAAEQLRAN